MFEVQNYTNSAKSPNLFGLKQEKSTNFASESCSLRITQPHPSLHFSRGPKHASPLESAHPNVCRIRHQSGKERMSKGDHF